MEPREKGRSPQYSAPPRARADVDEDLGVRHLLLEDQVVLQLEEVEQVAGLGDVAVRDGHGVGVGGQLGLQGLGDSRLVCAVDVGSSRVGNELGRATVV